ncbi:DNA repair protein rhp54 [Hordeum vulgare]|nr:DNA repair protein rhp54 [Hordeum vulgare]
MVAASTGSSAFLHMVLPETPRASATHPIPVMHVYPQASRLFGECSPEVSMVAPSTSVPAPVVLNATSIADGSSSGGPTKRVQEMLADMLSDARNLFDRMPAAVDNDRANGFMQSIIFEGNAAVGGIAAAAGYDPEETQSQDGSESFMSSTYDQAGMQAAFSKIRSA